MGDEAEAIVHVHYISLNIKCVFLLFLPMWLHCYGNLKFP